MRNAGKKKVVMRNAEIKFFQCRSRMLRCSLTTAYDHAVPPPINRATLFFSSAITLVGDLILTVFQFFFSYLFYLECCPLSSASASAVAVASELLCCVAASCTPCIAVSPPPLGCLSVPLHTHAT